MIRKKWTLTFIYIFLKTAKTDMTRFGQEFLFQPNQTKPRLLESNALPCRKGSSMSHIGVARICRGGSFLQKGVVFAEGRSFCQKFQIFTVNFQKNYGERNLTVNFKDFFPKGGRSHPPPRPPCLRICHVTNFTIFGTQCLFASNCELILGK
jgi:hypothetical protein